MYDIIIAGAGTAGMTAAIYASRAGKKVLIVEELMYGGQIVKAENVVNYPGIKSISGADFAISLYEQATSYGAEFLFAPITRVIDHGTKKTVHAGEKDYDCTAVIIATGAKNRPLGIKGEKELIGKGVSYCATCDGNFYKNKTTAVIGGGNTALDDALYLCELCKKVYVIHRKDKFSGEDTKQKEVKSKKNIEIIMNTSVLEILGNPNVYALTTKHEETGKEQQVETEGVFVAIGHMPGNHIFLPLVELNPKGYILATEEGTTKTPGIFAAGDCREKNLRQLATAASDGANAAVAAMNYIKQVNIS